MKKNSRFLIYLLMITVCLNMWAAEEQDQELSPEGLMILSDKRDPFEPYEDVVTDLTQIMAPLQKYGIEQLKVAGVIWGIENPKAMIITPDSEGYVVEKGSLIGKNWGKVTQILKDKIIVQESYSDITGQTKFKDVILSLGERKK